MESKSMEMYFSKAKSLPVAMSIAEIQQLVSAKGVTSPPKKSWFNLNNLIIMTTSILIICSAILSMQTEESAYVPSKTIEFNQFSEKQSKSIKSQGNAVLLNNFKPDLEVTTALPIGDSVYNKNEIIADDMQVLEPMGVMAPAEPLEPMSPIEETMEPLESKLGGDVEGERKQVTKEVALSGITTFEMTHSNGKVEIETWNENKIEVTATFTVSAKEEEDELLAKNDFDFDLNTQGFKVILESNWDKINNCGCNDARTSEPKGLKKLFYFPSKNKAKTTDGKSFEYENFKIEYTIKIPKRLNVDVTNKYSDVSIASIDGNLDATIFRGNVKANDVGGDVKLKANYGGATFGKFSNGDLSSFRSNVSFQSANEVKIKANYSELVAEKINQLNVNAFRSDLTLNSALEQLEGSVKYGDMTIAGAVTEANLKLFRANLEAPSFQDLTLSSNYGSLETESVDELLLDEAFRSELKVAEVGSIKGKVNYSPLTIKTLKNDLDLKNFRSDITVDLVKADFSGITINAKYANIQLKFSPEAKYELDAVTTYTAFNVPEEIMSKSHQNAVNNNANHFIGVFNKESSKATSLVNVETFQGELRLN